MNVVVLVTITLLKFFDWFCKYKSDDMIDCMLPDVKARAGINDIVGKRFTTNQSESLNKIIKIETNWKESKLPTLISHLKKVAGDHEELVMKTIIRKEQWKFTCQYQSFHVDEHAWYSKMTKESKLKHYKRVQSAHYKVPVPSSSSNLAIGLGTKKLSVSFEVLKDVDILPTTLVGIWQKAESLLSNHHIVKVPWSENVKDRLVKSASSDVPHVVKVKRTNLFSCDSSCSMYTGFSICAHVVASAEDNGELSSYLNTFTSSFNAPNLTAIATQGLPGGAGRKGGRTKRKRAAKTPIESVSTRVCF